VPRARFEAATSQQQKEPPKKMKVVVAGMPAPPTYEKKPK
jgi:hypothetical protein